MLYFKLTMLLILHILLATSSLSFMAAALIGKVWKKNDYTNLTKLSGVSFMGMFATGIALGIKYHKSLMGVCMSGLFYLAILAIIYAAYKKLAIER